MTATQPQATPGPDLSQDMEVYGPQFPALNELYAAQDAPLEADRGGCTEAEYQRLVLERQQTELAFLAGHDRRLENDLEARAEPGGRDMTAPEPQAGPETAREYVAGLVENAERARQAREAETALGHDYEGREAQVGTPEYEAMSAEYEAEAWGGKGPSASYEEWKAEGRIVVDLEVNPELEPDLGPTPESIEQGAEPDDAYRSPEFVADPMNPTDAELAAAIQRGLADGTLIDAADWMERQREADAQEAAANARWQQLDRSEQIRQQCEANEAEREPCGYTANADLDAELEAEPEAGL